MTILNKVSNKTLMPGITAIPDVPDAPTIGAVTDLGTGTSVSVAYTAAATGGTVTTFTATSTPGSLTGTGTSPITVSGLTAGTAYTFKVKGTNATATGPESAASNSVTPVLLNSYESIATFSGTGSSGVITFTSIPQTYKHLQVRAILRGTASATANGTDMRFNSDSGANYTLHRLIGNGSAASADGYTGRTGAWLGLETDANALASTYAACVTDILDYTNTNKYTTTRSLGAYDLNGSGQVNFASAVWLNTAAITSITITAASSGNWATGSSFALYGIKG